MATGFHRNTLTNKEGGVDQEQFRVDAVVDRVNTTSKVWLGITMDCCQCHDHKYDPFSQREYYQFFAFFNSDVEVDIDAAPWRNDVAAAEGRKPEAHAKQARGIPEGSDDCEKRQPEGGQGRPHPTQVNERDAKKPLTDHRPNAAEL